MSRKNTFARWRKIREKGKKHYIISYGVLGWGIPAGFIFFIFEGIIAHGFDISKYFTGDWMSSFLVGLISCLLGGILYGYLMWGANEKKYHKEYLNR
ncbi:hypothetical protein LF817_14195 [Halobacillus sp. A1]|uniref:hypothetical protein n=1 Tax=Halobacillus sp. A1 TaxID=2880262 RepID=UPI0020A66EA6|nr:hypothetical protein [Halobacillus sp. A1]MCP3032474.1 hypothetical protein [Halobacillus sp. A1]